MPSGDYLKGKGPGLLWLKGHLGHADDACLIWPYSGNHQGYGHCGYYGKIVKAHRLMCILAHGEPPTPQHHAAHSCGNGHGGCVNPRHLSWKTPLENRLEANAHGTGNAKAPRRLTIDQVEEIRASSRSYIDLAAEYGVKVGTIGKIIRGETWIIPRSTLTRDQLIRLKQLAGSMTIKAAAETVGMKLSVAYRVLSKNTFSGLKT